VYNFSAGPAVLPEPVLKELAEEMMDYQGCGMSVMEMSHRSPEFQKIIDEAEQDLRDLMNIPDNYKVLFLQGGASQQFAMIPMNLMKNGVADYIVTGQWAKKAYQEAQKYGKVTAEGLAESALRNVALLEKYDFDDIVISLKSSDVKMNYEAYKIVNDRSDYPLHIGVTEAGTPSRGKIKSAAGVGALLLEDIGDTMRISLTADPVEEVLFAKELLAALGIRKDAIEIVSCPTCGRTEVDLEKIAESIERRIHEVTEKGVCGIKIAVMGCAVNGPGEARGADLGVACGKGKGVIFSGGEILKTVPEEKIADEIIKLAGEYDKNTGEFH